MRTRIHVPGRLRPAWSRQSPPCGIGYSRVLRIAYAQVEEKANRFDRRTGSCTAGRPRANPGVTRVATPAPPSAAPSDIPAAPCGGDFGAFLDGIRSEAAAAGYKRRRVESFLAGARQDPKVLRADRAQGVFRKSFIDFAQSAISRNRIDNGVLAGPARPPACPTGR
ncbi:MAG: lytic murein transglycosylase [Pseudomonadota bacterium]